jgi:hypothetical protein
LNKCVVNVHELINPETVTIIGKIYPLICYSLIIIVNNSHGIFFYIKGFSTIIKVHKVTPALYQHYLITLL